MAKYLVGFKVECRVYLEVEANCIEDAFDVADDQKADIDIGAAAEDFEWEATSARQIYKRHDGLLGVVYGNEIYKEMEE